VEYGLKQNDAAILSPADDAPYYMTALSVLITRLLVIPSLAFAPWLLSKTYGKWVQFGGFLGCALMNGILAIWYGPLKPITVLFDAIYILQMSFQSLPGVTTMAIPADIYPSCIRGTGAGISAAMGKVGATFGSYYFSQLKNEGHINAIFWFVTITAAVAALLTWVTIPKYNGNTLDDCDALIQAGDSQEAAKVLFSGPRPERLQADSETSEDEKVPTDEWSGVYPNMETENPQMYGHYQAPASTPYSG